MHAEADVKNRAGERLALAHCLANGESAGLTLDVAEKALSVYRRLLDGVCLEAGIAFDH